VTYLCTMWERRSSDWPKKNRPKPRRKGLSRLTSPEIGDVYTVRNIVEPSRFTSSRTGASLDLALTALRKSLTLFTER